MLTDNKTFLRKYDPILLEKIKDKKEDGIIELEDTKNGQKTLRYIKDDSSIYLHSKYNPIREAESIIDKLEEREDIDEDSHIIFYGLGLGYHIEVFTKRYPNTNFSLYEPSVEVFNKFLEHIKLKDLGVRNIENISCEYDNGTKQTFLKKIMKSKEKEIIILDLPIYEKVFEEEQKEFFKDFKDIIKSEKSNMDTNYAFQKRWVINSIINLKEVINTPNILLEKRGKFKGKPAILVAAGPSLNEEIENIRYIKENGLAYIFSVGSAINTLIHHDIYPDAMTSYDPGEFNQNVVKGIKEKDIKDIPLIFGSSVGHETLENYPGEKHHMITSQDSVSNYYLKTKEYGNINMVRDAPTIAIVTIQLLNELGFNKIILVGQNLAYKGKERHSEGISYSSRLTDEQIKNAISVKGVDEEKVLTNATFNTMREQMESYIEQMIDIDVINTTKDGAHIEGTEFIDLSALIKKDLREKVVEKDYLSGNKTNYDREHLNIRLKRMDREYKKALKINKTYKDILNKIDKSINNRKFSQAEDLYVKLDKELRKIEKNEFYKTFILGMNRVEYKILAESIDHLNSIRDPYEKGNTIIASFKGFIDICERDIDNIKVIYTDMKQGINKYLNLNNGAEV